jgi:hypothetical protein
MPRTTQLWQVQNRFLHIPRVRWTRSAHKPGGRHTSSTFTIHALSEHTRDIKGDPGLCSTPRLALTYFRFAISVNVMQSSGQMSTRASPPMHKVAEQHRLRRRNSGNAGFA